MPAGPLRLRASDPRLLCGPTTPYYIVVAVCRIELLESNPDVKREGMGLRVNQIDDEFLLFVDGEEVARVEE